MKPLDIICKWLWSFWTQNCLLLVSWFWEIRTLLQSMLQTVFPDCYDCVAAMLANYPASYGDFLITKWKSFTCFTDVPLFLSGLFNDYLNPFNISGYDHSEPKTAFYWWADFEKLNFASGYAANGVTWLRWLSSGCNSDSLLASWREFSLTESHLHVTIVI